MVKPKPLVNTITTPVHIVDVLGPDDSWNAAWGKHPLERVAESEPRDRCYLCNQALQWRAVLLDATGATHIVGQDCAARLGGRSVGQSVTYARQRSELRSAAEVQRLEALKELEQLMGGHRSELAQHPHPMAARMRQFKKLTLLDYAQWWAENGNAKASDLRRAAGLLRGAVAVREAVAALGAAADSALRQEPGVRV